MLDRRKNLSPTRRQEGAHQLIDRLRNLKGKILSFSPIGSEIDLTPLNDFFANEKRLFLVPSYAEQWVEFPFSQIDCVLVPGLGFDRENYRLGYGKGYYDRLLAQMPLIRTIGVGFQEQFCEELLPRDSWDVPVSEVILV